MLNPYQQYPQDPFQPEPEIDPQLMALKKDFTPDLVALGKEFESEENRLKREAYRANHTLEQKKQVLESWKEFMKDYPEHLVSNEHLWTGTSDEAGESLSADSELVE